MCFLTYSKELFQSNKIDSFSSTSNDGIEWVLARMFIIVKSVYKSPLSKWFEPQINPAWIWDGRCLDNFLKWIEWNKLTPSHTRQRFSPEFDLR